MSDIATTLKKFVMSEGRVWPHKWHEFYKLCKKYNDEVPAPLILGGSIASDMAKRVRLLTQIQSIEKNDIAIDAVDNFLRSIPLEEWHLAEDPLSNIDIEGHEDIPPLFYVLLT